MNKHIKEILFFSSPLILKYLFLLVFDRFDVFNYEDLIEDLLFCTVIYVLLVFIAKGNAFLRNAIFAAYVLYFILEGTSYMAVSANFTSSYMYLLIETSPEEFSEFYSLYQSFGTLLLILLLIASFLLLKRAAVKKFKYQNAFLGLAIVFALTATLKLTGLIESNAYHNIVRGVYGYYELQDNYVMDHAANVSDITKTRDNDVLVVVLGESTARGHLGLYGYERNTTPLLSGMKDSLYVYNDVISTDVFTLKAVPKMLTSLSNTGNEESIISLVDIFNKANLKTYWLSNHRPISYHDNAISSIASQSSYFKFYNHKIDKHTTVLDEVMFPRYNEILEEAGKKLIVVRLIGTHFDYHKRYPPSFDNFNGRSSKKEKAIDQYDNAVLYNDYIVHSMISDLKRREGKHALLYLSDHGENIYEEGDFIGRLETNVKKNMLDIPFLLWTSNDFELPEDFDFQANRKFMTDRLFESLGHLFGVQHALMDPRKSIFSRAYQEPKRIIVNGIDYDRTFSNGNE